MLTPYIHRTVATAIMVFLVVVLIPSTGPAESLKDGIILRDNASLFLKDGSTVACSRIIWLVTAADFVQCDKGDHAVEIKLKDLNFEKTFGSDLAREYAAMKGNLAEEHEKSRKEQEANTVTYESAPRQETGESAPAQEEKPAEAQKGARNEDVGDVWEIKPGTGVGWITLGMPYDKIIEGLGKTILESDLPPDGKHHRYALKGIEFWYKNEKITAMRVGTSSDKEYSPNKYKCNGVGIGSRIDDVVAAMGQPDHITISKYTSVDKYVYKSGIYFSKYKSRDTVYTITVFPKEEYDRYLKD